jgi:Prokaryotic E2 family E
MHPLVADQFSALKGVYPEASADDRPEGSVWIAVPRIALPPGWNAQSTKVHFLTPVAYPQARPDCFYADSTLRLASGGMPTNANLQSPPFGGQQLVWFSWHVSHWQPNTDDLLTYLDVIKQRLREAR